jgi:hypothetical protein
MWPDQYLPMHIPGVGVVVAFLGLTLLGFLAVTALLVPPSRFPLEALKGLDDPRHLHPDDPVLAATLGALRGAAYTVSDRLTERFFGHAAAIQRTPLAG